MRCLCNDDPLLVVQFMNKRFAFEWIVKHGVAASGDSVGRAQQELQKLMFWRATVIDTTWVPVDALYRKYKPANALNFGNTWYWCTNCGGHIFLTHKINNTWNNVSPLSHVMLCWYEWQDLCQMNCTSVICVRVLITERMSQSLWFLAL